MRAGKHKAAPRLVPRQSALKSDLIVDHPGRETRREWRRAQKGSSSPGTLTPAQSHPASRSPPSNGMGSPTAQLLEASSPKRPVSSLLRRMSAPRSEMTVERPGRHTFRREPLGRLVSTAGSAFGVMPSMRSRRASEDSTSPGTITTQEEDEDAGTEAGAARVKEVGSSPGSERRGDRAEQSHSTCAAQDVGMSTIRRVEELRIVNQEIERVEKRVSLEARARPKEALPVRSDAGFTHCSRIAHLTYRNTQHTPWAARNRAMRSARRRAAMASASRDAATGVQAADECGHSARQLSMMVISQTSLQTVSNQVEETCSCSDACTLAHSQKLASTDVGRERHKRRGGDYTPGADTRRQALTTPRGLPQPAALPPMARLYSHRDSGRVSSTREASMQPSLTMALPFRDLQLLEHALGVWARAVLANASNERGGCSLPQSHSSARVTSTTARRLNSLASDSRKKDQLVPMREAAQGKLCATPVGIGGSGQAFGGGAGGWRGSAACGRARLGEASIRLTQTGEVLMHSVPLWRVLPWVIAAALIGLSNLFTFWIGRCPARLQLSTCAFLHASA